MVNLHPRLPRRKLTGISRWRYGVVIRRGERKKKATNPPLVDKRNVCVCVYVCVWKEEVTFSHYEILPSPRPHGPNRTQQHSKLLFYSLGA